MRSRVVFGLAVGIYGAWRPGSWGDRVATFGAYLGVSFPVYWVGLHADPGLRGVAPVVAAVGLGRHRVSWCCPRVTLGMRSIAFIARMTRTAMQEVLASDFVRTARAKGLGEGGWCSSHGLRNALLPVITVIGLDFGSYLTGSILTETIFAWPGVGRYVLTAIEKRDLPGDPGQHSLPERGVRAGEPDHGPDLCEGGSAGGVLSRRTDSAHALPLALCVLCVRAPVRSAQRSPIDWMPPRRSAARPPPLGHRGRGHQRPPALRAGTPTGSSSPRRTPSCSSPRRRRCCCRRTGPRGPASTATGPVSNGVLQGHLVLYGRGDPTMGRRCYAVDTTAGRRLPDRSVRAAAGAGARPRRARHHRHRGRPRGRRQLVRARDRFTPRGRPATWTGGTRRRCRGWASPTTASRSSATADDAGRAGDDHRVARLRRRGPREPDPHVPPAQPHDLRHRARPGAAGISSPRRRARRAAGRGTRVRRGRGPEPLHRAGAAPGAGGERDRRARRDPLHGGLDAVPGRAERRGPRRGRVAAAPRLDLPDPQHQPELVRGDAAQAAGPTSSARREAGTPGLAWCAGSSSIRWGWTRPRSRRATARGSRRRTSWRRRRSCGFSPVCGGTRATRSSPPASPAAGARARSATGSSARRSRDRCWRRPAASPG